MPVRPFSLLIKPTSADCNLRCRYCFYLKKGSLYPDTVRHRMSDDVLEAMISSYMSTDQPVYAFGWQGGEPGLMGLEFFRKVVAVQEKYGHDKNITANSLQTNGTLIDDEFAAFLAEHNFLVGISIDGPKDIHDAYRLKADGSGSHDDVIRGMECLKRNNVEFNVLTLVNSVNVKRGRDVYRYLCDIGINYQQYIPCVEYDATGSPLPFAISGEEWGSFLCEIFDEWIKTDTRKVSVRLFDSIIAYMVNGTYTACNMAGNCCQYFVVEHNGDVYPCDFFVEKDRRLGNVSENTWEELQDGGKYNTFGRQKSVWNNACSRCEYLQYCSGDCLKHRFHGKCEPSQLSLLCPGWKKFYNHTLPRFKELAYSVLKEQPGIGVGAQGNKLFIDIKPERNEVCFCGSGKKYKKCHGA